MSGDYLHIVVLNVYYATNMIYIKCDALVTFELEIPSDTVTFNEIYQVSFF